MDTLLFILSGLFASTAEPAGLPLDGTGALLYSVDESAYVRGSISVYDIAAEHRLIKTIHTVPGVGDVRGVAASAVTGKLYAAYIDVSGTGMVFCLNIYDDTILWNRPISPGVDRLAINPDGQLLYLPTWEGGSADYINVLDADTGEVVRKVHFSNRSHDTLYPLSGPIFQETKADNGSGNYLYLIDPKSYVVSRVGPYLGILGPYAVDSSSNWLGTRGTRLRARMSAFRGHLRRRWPAGIAPEASGTLGTENERESAGDLRFDPLDGADADVV